MYIHLISAQLAHDLDEWDGSERDAAVCAALRMGTAIAVMPLRAGARTRGLMTIWPGRSAAADWRASRAYARLSAALASHAGGRDAVEERGFETFDFDAFDQAMQHATMRREAR